VGGDIVDLGGPLASLLVRIGLVAVVVAVAVGCLVWLRRGGAATRTTAGRLAQEVEPRGRQFVRLAFGMLWIADGLLQLQPLMPAGFVSQNIDPHLNDQAAPLRSLVEVLTRAWDRHPVVADMAVVCVEIGLGVLLVTCRRGRAGRAVAWFAIVAAVLIWVLGEGLGGLMAAGAGWLTGAPGAVLVYVAAASLLLAPWSWWTSGRASALVRHLVAAWLIGAAVLQTIPAEGFWTASGAAGPFVDGAAMSQPSWLVAPIRSLAVFARDHPGVLNLVVIGVLVAVAVWLELDLSTTPLVAGIAVCLLTWWWAQDFGVLGGTATDPNTALPLALLLAGALPYWQTPAPARVRDDSRLRNAAWVGGIAFALVLALAAPAVLAVRLAGPPDSAALAVDSHGGLRAIPARAVPGFSLVDQDGRRVTSSSLRGRVVVVTFLDPVCASECPLIAGQLASADRALGTLAKHVEFIAIDSNPVFHSVPDVAAFTQSHGLADLPNWHFLCGEPAYTQGVLAEFGMAINVPTVGMIEHSSGVLFVSASGDEAAYLDDGAAEQLTASYADVVEHELRDLVQ
jgi:cytochrome oxidase Cu insertion factor (SCO1/SenC/PrrC family)